MRVMLFPLSATEGRKLWRSAFPTAEFPPRTTKWFRIIPSSVEAWDAGRHDSLGWFACRYHAARKGRAAALYPDGVHVKEKYRGKGIQNAARAAAVRLYHRGGRLVVKSYVNATNTASLRNCVKSGYLPVKSFREGDDVFISLEMELST